MNEVLLLHGLDGLGQPQLSDADRVRMLQDPRVPQAIKDALITGQRARREAPIRAERRRTTARLHSESEARRLAAEKSARRRRIEAESREVLHRPALMPDVEAGRLRAQKYTEEAKLRRARDSFNRLSVRLLPGMPATVQRMVAQLAQGGVYADIVSIPGFTDYADGRITYGQLAARIAADFGMFKAKARADREVRLRLQRAIEELPTRAAVVPSHPETPGSRAMRAPPRTDRAVPSIRVRPPPPTMPLPAMTAPSTERVSIARPPPMPPPRSAQRAREGSEAYRIAKEYVRRKYPRERSRTKIRQLWEETYGRIVTGQLTLDSRGVEIPKPRPAPAIRRMDPKRRPMVDERTLPARLRWRHRPLISR